MKLILTYSTFIFTFLLTSISRGQSRYNDSIMAIRITDSLPGKIRTYYTPGYKQRAFQFQKLFTQATKFYEQRYHTALQYRIAVLDSSQWVTEKFAFGYLAYDSGWVFLPARVKSPFFKNIYGINNQSTDLKLFIRKQHLTIAQLSDAVYSAYSLHELGHYFTDDKEQVIVPDMFANELIATYFSYCYLKTAHDPSLRTLISFSEFIKKQYKPKYRNIEAMDSLYSAMPIQNFKWFHCNIVLLCQQIYNVYGLSFLDYYLQTFPAGTANHFTTEQVVALLDKKCKGKVSAWAKEMMLEN